MSNQATATASISETLVTNLLAALKPQLPDLHGRSWEEIETAVRDRATHLAEQNATRASDAPTRQWLRLASTILAAYRELQPVVGNGQTTLALLRDAMAAPFKERLAAYLTDRFGISPEAPEEAFSHMAENFKARGEERFGSSFTYVQAVQDGTRSFTHIHKCLFNDFFRANGAAEVTPIFCAIDNLWAEELEKPQYGVRFERPTTLAGGGDRCRFEFTKTTTKS